MKPIYLIIIFVVLATFLSSVFVINQKDQGLVLRLGKPDRQISKPGLHFKIPFVENVEVFEKRILNLNADPEEIIASDSKRMIVDAFVKYRITDSLKFYQAVTYESRMKTRLNPILRANLRQVLGKYPLSSLLTAERTNIMNKIRDRVNAESKEFGIDIVDVRIRRADLPEENSQAVYRRMQTEREREAKEFRAKGAEEAQHITSRADRDRIVLLANAKRDAEILRGEGDKEAANIFANAFNQDPKFFEFYRTMQAYKKTLNKDNTKMVLSPDSDFLRYFSSMNPHSRR